GGYPADRTGRQAAGGKAGTRPEHGRGRGPLRRAAGEAGPARRPEEAVAGDPPLGLPGLRGLLREGPGDRRGRAQGLAERDRSQAAGPLILPRPAPAGRAFCAGRTAGTVRSAAAPPIPARPCRACTTRTNDREPALPRGVGTPARDPDRL